MAAEGDQISPPKPSTLDLGHSAAAAQLASDGEGKDGVERREEIAVVEEATPPPARTGGDDEEESRGAEDGGAVEEGSEVNRESKRRKTCPAALDKLEKSDGRCERGAEAAGVGEDDSGSGLSFSFDTRGLMSPIGMTPKFGSFPPLYNSSADLGVDLGTRKGAETGGGGGDVEGENSKRERSAEE